MGARSTYHVIVIHQIHLPRITLNRAHERLCSLHPLIDRRLAQSLHLCCLKSPLNAPDLQQWGWCKLGLFRSRLFSHFVLFTNHNSNHQMLIVYDNLCDLWQMERCRASLRILLVDVIVPRKACLWVTCHVSTQLHYISVFSGNWRSMQRSQYRGER